MRSYDAPTLAVLSNRQALVARQLVWIRARNRSTGLPETLGVWTGLHDLDITLEGEARTYIGTGGALAGEPITAAPGLSVRVHQLRLSGVAPEVKDLVGNYDTRFAPVEIHRAILDPTTYQIAGTPHRTFRGFENGLNYPRAAAGGLAEIIMDLVSETRSLTRTLPTKKSDDSHRARGGDRGRRYADISGSVPVYWGELYAAAPADTGPAPPQQSRPFGDTPHGY